MTDAPTLSAEYRITNKRGLHARAAAKFVKCVEEFDAEVTVRKNGLRANGHSIMGLMLLAASPGTVIHVSAEGADAERVLTAIGQLIDTVSTKTDR